MRSRWISYGLALLAACAVVPLVVLELRRAVEVPYWDEWEWVYLIGWMHDGSLTFAELWAPHNEHRTLFPNLLMLLMDRLWGWSVVREQLLSLAMLALTQLCIWIIIQRTVRTARRGVVFLVTTVLLFSLCQDENFDWGFQIGWFLCNLSLAVAIVALTTPRRSPAAFALACVAATVGSMSGAQGLLIWGAGLVVLLLLPRRAYGAIVAWVVCGTIVFAVVEHGSSGGHPPHSSLRDLGELSEYTLTYLGSPLARSGGVARSVLAGCAIVTTLLIAALGALRLRGRRRVRLAPWLGMGAYAVAAALVTSFGRGTFGVEQALASRYTSIGLYASICVIATVLVLAPRGRALFASALLVACIVAGSIAQSVAGNREWVTHEVTLAAARDALARGDTSQLSVLYPVPSLLEQMLGELAALHDGIFTNARPGSRSS